MKKTKEYDFSGYATKNGLKCSDGRVILKDAFKHNDGMTVPLVWQHLHNEPGNVLGHAVLENREDGVYAYGKFNGTEAGKNAKELVMHGDITALSIYANELKQRGTDVLHGVIREVSLVLSGANPGAFIDNLSIAHGDGSYTEDETEAIIYTGLELTHGGTQAAEEDGKTVQDVIDTMNEEQKQVLYALVGAAAELEVEDEEDSKDEGAAKHSAIDENNDEGGHTVKHNVFDNKDEKKDKGKTLSHSDIVAIFEDAKKCGSLKEAVLAHAVTYGIDNIDYLFPDAKDVLGRPEFVQRRMDWVAGVINGARHTPFSRIKSMAADITEDTARAKGYVKGALKREEFFALTKRITTPTTIYKKQKLDRDDLIDITDMDVVAWLKAEMRMMLDEELARAVLVGDGRDPASADKINTDNIRPIAFDNTFYAHRVDIPTGTTAEMFIELILRNRPNYKGSGNPVLYTTEEILTDMLLLKDKVGRRLYTTETELASALRVSKIETPEILNTVQDSEGRKLQGILVNMRDYVIGADKGGQVSMFDDFDIDYNQYKYLIETRCSGALVLPKSALVFWKAPGTKATPTAPTFVSATNKLTIPTVTGVGYYIAGVKQSAGDQTISANTTVTAQPENGYYFEPNTVTEWTFEYNPGTKVTPTAPTFDGTTNTITIPTCQGVGYYINNVEQSAGTVVISVDTTVEARAETGYYLDPTATISWTFTYVAI